jgi:hypothetical protein
MPCPYIYRSQVRRASAVNPPRHLTFVNPRHASRDLSRDSRLETRNRGAYAPAGCALAGGVVASVGFGLICNAKPAAIIAITPPDKKAKL